MRGGLLRIAINEGRWRGIPLEQRICPLCNSGAIEDECHILYNCIAWNGFRPVLSQFPHFREHNLSSLFDDNAPRSFYVKLSEYLQDVVQVRADVLKD